ncbi:hypothetical protein CPC08DRAFT_723578 [Agrocybe pediades]|nr:hypothetical protein CPC08DRAFT_723578 [Agrocybe pediades]
MSDNKQPRNPTEKSLFNADLFHRQRLESLEIATRSLFSRLDYWIGNVTIDSSESTAPPSPVVVALQEVRKYLDLFLDGVKAGQTAFKHCEAGIDTSLKIAPTTKKEKWGVHVEEMQRNALLVAAVGNEGYDSYLQFRSELVEVNTTGLYGISPENVDVGPLLLLLPQKLDRDHALYVLRWLRQSLDKYLAWWNDVRIEGVFLFDNSVMLSQVYGLLRHKGTITGWDSLRSRYASYVTKMQRLNDDYRVLFSLKCDFSSFTSSTFPDTSTSENKSFGSGTTLIYTTALTSQHYRSHTTSVYSFTPADSIPDTASLRGNSRTLTRKKKFIADFSIASNSSCSLSNLSGGKEMDTSKAESLYSYASSRTTSTDYGIYYIRWKDSPILRDSVADGDDNDDEDDNDVEGCMT